MEAVIGADCSLQVIEHENGGARRVEPTTLHTARVGGVRYLWIDAAWANRGFDVDATPLDQTGDIYLFAYTVRRDRLQLSSTPHRALAHRVLDKDIVGDVLMQAMN